jgi:tetratricopeptide (TPR) repeat protein
MMQSAKTPRFFYYSFLVLSAFVLLACNLEKSQALVSGSEEVETTTGSYAASRAYLMAAVAEREGNLEQAAASYLEALAEDPDNKGLRDRAYNLALATGKMDTAIRLAKTFTQADEPGAIAWTLLAIDAARREDYKQALVYLSRARQATPELLHFAALQAYMDMASGADKEGVLLNFRNFEGHAALEARKQYHLARLYLKAGQQKKALEALEISRRLEPGGLFTSLLLGGLLEQQDNFPAAYEVYEGFLERNPDALLIQHVFDRLGEKPVPTVLPTPTLSQDMGEVLFGFAMLMWSQGLDIPARQIIHMTLWLDEAPYYRFYAGMMAEQAQDWPQALAFYGTLKQKEPGWLAARLRMADVLFKEGDVTQAIALIRDLKKRHPNKTIFDRILAEMYYQKEDYAAAIQYYDAVFSKLEKAQDERYVSLYFARGASYERLQQFDKAAADLSLALKLDPDNPSILNYLGYMWLELDKNLDQAFSYISKAALLNPNDGAILDSLGWGYFKKGEYARALLYLERAAEMIPDDPTIVEHLGDVHLELGNAAKAQQYWKQAWDLGPVGTRERERLAKKLRQNLAVEKE